MGAILDSIQTAEGVFILLAAFDIILLLMYKPTSNKLGPISKAIFLVVLIIFTAKIILLTALALDCTYVGIFQSDGIICRYARI